jgi:hypothetical protein
MTDSVARQRLPVPLEYRHADRDQVFAILLHQFVHGTPVGAQLTTKSLSDPTVALLDAWASLADVIDFYQERIASENYLTTAVEPESVLALATLLGYRPRPGLAATTYLAYTLVADPNNVAVLLPAHQIVQSVPGTGELPQTFETAADLVARPSWNTLAVKATAPLQIDVIEGNALTPEKLVVSGANTQLKPNGILLIAPSELRGQPTPKKFLVVKVERVEADPVANTTTLPLQGGQILLVEETSRMGGPGGLLGTLSALVAPLTGTQAPAEAEPMVRVVPMAAVVHQPPEETPPEELSDMTTNVLTALNPDLARTLFPALATTRIGRSPIESVRAMRVTTAPFGVTVPPRARFDSRGQQLPPQEWPVADTQTIRILADVTTEAVTGHNPMNFALRTHISVANPSDKGYAFIDDNILRDDEAAGMKIKAEPLTTLEFTPDQDHPTLEAISISIEGDNNLVVKNESSGASATISLYDAVAAGAAPFPAPTTADSGLFLTVSYAPLPDPQAAADEPPTRGQFAIEVALALPIGANPPLDLDDRCDGIVPDSYVIVRDTLRKVSPGADDQPANPLVARVEGADPITVNRYGTTKQVTRLTLKSEAIEGRNVHTTWISPNARLLSELRSIVVDAAPDDLELLPMPTGKPISGSTIAISGLHPGIGTGRRLIITGIRADLGDATVQAQELIEVADVAQAFDQGETPYTKLSLTTPLRYSYQTDSATVYGNVALAQQGTTITETPTAAGDPRNPTFTLAQSPVLADPSSTGTGFATSLTLVIDGRIWTAVPRLDGATPPRCYLVGTDGQGRSTVTLSQPLPHPASIVTATYRVGDGAAGNVRAGQLTQLLTKPLAVASVTNPLPASGGSTADGADVTRINAPRGLEALGRVVSVQDAADIALAWAGIGKSMAVMTSDGQRNVLKVTVAGTSPTPLEKDSMLVNDLRGALAAAGDVVVPIVVEPAAVSLIVMTARIRHQQDFTWDGVERAVRQQLVDTFAYAHRDIDEDVIISDLLAVIHRVDGVRSCSIDRIGLIPSDIDPTDLAKFTPAQPRADGRVRVSGIAHLSETVTETLNLEEDPT